MIRRIHLNAFSKGALPHSQEHRKLIEVTSELEVVAGSPRNTVLGRHFCYFARRYLKALYTAQPNGIHVILIIARCLQILVAHARLWWMTLYIKAVPVSCWQLIRHWCRESSPTALHGRPPRP